MATIWADFISGQVQENPLSNVATTLTMSGRLQDLPSVGGGDVAYLTIDPEGVDVLAGSGTEVVSVTAYIHAAGTATVARGQRGTTARPHSQGVKIVLSWMAEDIKTVIQVDGVDFHSAKKVGFGSGGSVDITPSYAPSDDKVELTIDVVGGSGSGLDADTLDGHDSGYFATDAALTSEASTRASAVSSEASARASADSSEASTRASADSSEASTRASADTTLQNNINSEATNRANGDINLGALKLEFLNVGGHRIGAGAPARPIMIQAGSDPILADGAGQFQIAFPTTFGAGVICVIPFNGDDGAFSGWFRATNLVSWDRSKAYFQAINPDGTAWGGGTLRADWIAIGW